MNENETYHQLADACYFDNLNDLKEVLNQNNNLDLNKNVFANAGKRGNGTPLILTGTKEIAKLLIENGAKINFIHDTGSNKITALDSAIQELTKQSVRENEEKQNQIKDLILFLESQGAKKYSDLKGGK
jgi:hypothetical protein